MADYILAFVVSTLTVGLKGFQHKNVLGNHYRLVLATSILMSLGDVMVVGLIVQSGWSMAVPLGAGAGIGMMTSMWLHDRVVKPKKQP